MWQVIGQARAVSLLQRSLESGNLAHAYLFTGPPHTGKMALALDLARALNCEGAVPPCGDCQSCRKIASANHSDVQVIGLAQSASGEGKLRAEISIDQVREMQHSASLPPFEGRCKVFILNGAESLSNEAANCLLKTLEEPTGRVVFVLLTANEGILPATVISRCQRVELRPVALTEIEPALVARSVETDKAKLLARLCRGGIGWALSAAKDEGLLQRHTEKMDQLVYIISSDNEERFAVAAQLAVQFGQERNLVLDTLDLWCDYFRDLLLVKLGCPEAVTNIDRAAALAETARSLDLRQIRGSIESIASAAAALQQNASPRLALEVLMLDLPVKVTNGGERLTEVV